MMWSINTWHAIAMLPLAAAFLAPVPLTRNYHATLRSQSRLYVKDNGWMAKNDTVDHGDWNTYPVLDHFENDLEEQSHALEHFFQESDIEQQRQRLENIVQETGNDVEIVDHDMNAIFEIEECTILQQPQPAMVPIDDTSSTALISDSMDDKLGVVWKARLLLLAAAALYGTNFSFVKILGDTMPVGVSSTIRFGMAALVTLPWLFTPDHDEKPIALPASERNWLESALPSLASSPSLAAAACGFEVGLWTSMGYISQAVGLETTCASKSAFLCSLAVVIVPMLDFCIGIKLKPRAIVGAAMAVGGVGLLELGGGTSINLSSGDIASLVQPFAFGIGFWRMEEAMERFPEYANRVTAAQLLAVFLASSTYLLTGPLPAMSQVVEWVSDPTVLGALFWTGVITTALTVYMETIAMKTLSAAETTLIFSTEPLWGAACAAVVMGERFGMDAVIGCMFILGGCVVSNLDLSGKNKEEESPEKRKELRPSSSALADTSSLLARTGLAGATAGFVKTLEVVEMGDLDDIELVENVIQSASELM